MSGSKELKIILVPSFVREADQLAKRYPSLRADLARLRNVLKVNPQSGVSLGRGAYKIRFAIKSKGKGKRGGGRLITLYLERDFELFFLSIYDKSEQSSISERRINALIAEAVEWKLRNP